MSIVVPAILCGGSGTRLWPLSRAAQPKQFHPLVSERSMLAETVARAMHVPEAAAPVLIAGESMREIVLQEAPAGARIVLEPTGKNTAPAAALAAWAALEQSPEAIVLMLPSDHHVGDDAAFAAAMADGLTLAREGHIVTFGIEPDGPNTGYGYITAGAPLSVGFKVAKFEEKPLREKAEALIAAGGATWNAGIYMFGAQLYLDELKRLAPGMADAVEAAWRGGQGEAVRTLDAAAWARTPSDSIDYAVAEKTPHCAVIPVSMAWNDVGSWAALHEIGASGSETNVTAGDVILLDSKGSYVRAGQRLVALVGVENLVVIDTPDALLILPRDRTQDVKQIVEELKARGRKDLL
jgi:mannose-1-phosphate guanylyltransferase / mannose-6-phosphate isomerase